MRTPYQNNSPILCIAAREGFTDMVSLLLEFSASVDAVSDSGMSALCYAASAGHTEILRMLCQRNARVKNTSGLIKILAVMYWQKNVYIALVTNAVLICKSYCNMNFILFVNSYHMWIRMVSAQLFMPPCTAIWMPSSSFCNAIGQNMMVS